VTLGPLGTSVKKMFSSDTTAGDGEEHVYLDDSRTTLGTEKEKVLLKLTYGKTLAINNVLHVLSIIFNLYL